MSFLSVYLPICIYILLIILLIVGIILGVRLIGTADRLNDLLDDTKGKVDSLNGLFNVIDFTTDKIAGFSDSIINLTSKLVSHIGNKKKKNYEEEEDDYYE